MDYQGIIRESAAQGMVLLKNEGNTLPFTPSDCVAIFGRCQINYYMSGTGSGGSVHVPYSVNLIEGFSQLEKEQFPVPRLHEPLVQVYRDWIVEHPFDSGNGEWASEPWCQEEMALTEELVASAAKASTKAVMIVGRTAGEDQDNKAEKGSFYLTDTEYENLRNICAHFSQVVVVLNVSNVIDLSWIDSPDFGGHISAVLFSWQGGMQGGQACADILCGKANPSGKLADTIAYTLEDYPSTANFGSADDEVYAEDIFVGYRYFTTFAREKVKYPFGFGLSYTSFRIEPVEYDFDAAEMRIAVAVTNTGNCAGREVVQVYAACPQGALGKSAKVLCAFEKTDLLAPGETKTVHLVVPVRSLASYDDSGKSGYAHAFVLEKGTYSLFVGTDCFCRQKLLTKAGAEFVLSDTICVEQLTQCAAPDKAFSRMRPGERRADGLYAQETEPVPLSHEDLAEKIRANMPAPLAAPAPDAEKISYDMILKDPSLVDGFVAQLSDTELMTIVRGEGMMSRKVTGGIGSAFGGLSESLHSRGLPAVGCSDGPSGIRMDDGKKATLVPIGTLLACTWNPPLVEDLYVFMGRELCEWKIDVLLGPGCNIHRNPLNGRNFEYYSEDPLISGKMAAAVCRGLAQGGSIGTIKHFALNNQENHRRTENSVVSERALREIYLKPFEIAVKEGKAQSVMTAYNGMNGHKCASNFDLITGILRKEWGFTGFVMTDWWAAMNDCVKGGSATGRNIAQMVQAGGDVYMVVVNDTAESGGFGDNLPEALASGALTKAELQRSVKSVVLFSMQTLAGRSPLRPLKNEIVVHTELDSIPEGVHCYELEEYATGDALEGDMYMTVPETAQYEVFGAYAKDGGDTLSQSVSNVLINGEVCGSFECRSTGGKTTYAVAVQLRLKKGTYRLNFVHTKPGIQVQALCIRKEKCSPISAGIYE